MITAEAIQLIKKHEGSVRDGDRHVMYKCTAGKRTIGYGRNLDDCGISEYEANIMLKEDLRLCELDLIKIFGMDKVMYMPAKIFNVLIDMRFNLGAGGFRGFKKVIAAAHVHDTKTMIKEMKDSKWYRSECKGRVDDLIKILKG